MKLKIVLFACCIALLISCEERALETYYNQEGNFSGSIYEALDSTGFYDHFVLGVDSTLYANQLKYTLVTIVAPSDEAFNTYLNEHGYNSINDIPKGELINLIGHHIITWPQEPDVFTNEPNLFKRQTNMAFDTVVKYDIKTQANRTLLQEPKYLQFYTQEMLNYYNGTVEDYEMIAGTDLASTGFNIYDAHVDSIIPYGNGWVYYVDKVVEPLQNLDDWIMDADDYSLFNHMLNRFSIYVTDNNVKAGSLIKRSNYFSNARHYRIDMELCFETVGSSAQLGDVKIFPKGASNFTVIATKNEVLEKFVDETFVNYPGFKTRLKGIDEATMSGMHVKLITRALLAPFLFLETPVWPSNLYAGDFNGNDGTNLKLNPEDIVEHVLCSNGYGYGVNKYLVPRTFKSILKPAYTLPDYKYFTAAVDWLRLQSYLNDEDNFYTLFLPNDEAFLKGQVLALTADEAENDYGLNLESRNIGLQDFVFYDGVGGAMFDEKGLADILLNNIVIGEVTPTDQKQYVLNASNNYVGITKDSIWSGGNIIGSSTSRTKVANVIKTITDVDNGKVIEINEFILAPEYTLGDILNTVPEYSRFRDLCRNAGLYVDGVLEVFGEKPTLFVPTNEAIDQYIADGKLPTTEEELQTFVKYFFVNQPIFSTETINTTAVTTSLDPDLSTEFEIVYRNVEINGTYENLQIKGTNNDSYFTVIEGGLSNMICTDGIVHQIDGVLN